MKNNYTCCPWAVPLFLLSCFLGLIQVQAHTATKENRFQQLITGMVSDHQGLPLPGVNIMIKGSHQGSMTNLEGKYSINAAIGDTLSYSFMGYTTKFLVVTQNFDGDVQLQQKADALSEVVINAGYYTTTERERTGSIAKVTAEEIELQPIVNPLQALQGRMAGIEITQRGGAPGMAPKIRIRGQNSLRDFAGDNGNLPLYIVDGVPINSAPVTSYSGSLGAMGIDPLNTIGLSNIQSVEVLKDADATAIYGSRGANGVILVTTKKNKGYDKKTRVEARLYTGAGQVSRKMDLLHTQPYIQLREQAFENDGVEPTTDNAYDLLLWDRERYTDWQGEFLGGTSQILDMNVAITGGNENTNFRLGTNYHKEGTVFPGDFNYKKLANTLQLHHKSDNQKFLMDVSINYGLDTNNFLDNANLVYQAVSLPPNAPSIYAEGDSLNWEEWEEAGLNNPMAGLYNTSKIESQNLITNASLSYQLIDGLHLKTNLGYTNFHNKELVKMPKRSYSPSSQESISNRSLHSEINRKSWIIEPQLTYNKSIGKSNFNTLLGATYQESRDIRTLMNAYGYVSEAQIGNLMVAEDVVVNADEKKEYKYSAVFARIAYNWGHKYFINLTGRRDGSSRFGANNRFANFGAIGGAWIFSEEKFVNENLPFLSFGKLRGSYGTTGNDQIGDYGYLDAYEPTLAPGGIYPSQLTNPDYSWEVNKKLEIALALGIFNDRINTEINWYKNRSSNQLVGYTLPATTGFNSILANLPATVQNTGWEIILTSRNIIKEHFQWRTSFNITFPETKLIRFPNIKESSYANIYKVGSPLNIDLLYDYQGIDPDTGLYNVLDVNQDGNFDYEDRIKVRNNGRKYYGGIENTFSFKGFSLQFLWEFVKQEGISPRFLIGNIGNTTNQLEDVINNAKLQQPSQSIAAYQAFTYTANSTFSTTDASFLRLKTLSIGYTIPNTLTEKIGFSEGKIFLNGQNLFTITPYKGLDPQAIGIYLPILRTITGGIQLTL